jgi:hypothetical protein
MKRFLAVITLSLFAAGASAADIYKSISGHPDLQLRVGSSEGALASTLCSVFTDPVRSTQPQNGP